MTASLKTRYEVEKAKNALNDTPWWRPLRRHAAAQRYKCALLTAAFEEMS